MTDERLACLFRPSSIAVVGASDREGSRGAELLANLRSIGYPGRIHPVNPNRSTVAGLPAVSCLTDLDDPVDVVAVGVGHEAARQAIADAAEIGARAALVLGVGYAEAGRAGRRDQAELAALAHAADMRLVGPNSLGVWSRLDRVSYWLAPGLPLPFSGIGLITQSGALASSLIEPLSHRGIALDAIAATGNEADADLADFLAMFSADERLRVIGVIAESLRRPPELLEALRAARDRKVPVVCLITGTSRHGREAAIAHTAALLRDAGVARAVIEDAGAILVQDLAMLTEHLVCLSAHPGGLRSGVGLTTVSGGGAGLMADLAEDAGIALADLATETRETISTLLSGGNVSNPVDVMLAGDRPGTYDAVVERLARDPAVGTLAVGLNVPHAFDAAGAAFYADQVRAAARAGDGDVVAFSFVPGEPGAELQAAAAEGGIPLLLGAREGLAAIASAIAFASRITVAGGDTSAAPSPQVTSPGWTSEPGTADELEIRTWLGGFGVQVPAEIRVNAAEAAVAAAERIGFPVAVRVLAPGLVHKSELGAIRLGLAGPDAVAVAARDLLGLAAAIPGGSGLSVQAMAPPGTELILGARRDPGFGWVMLLGFGGVFVEALTPPRVAPLPRHSAAAERLIAELFGGAIERAQQIADLGALRDTVLAFAAAVRSLPDGVESFEINPLILSSSGALAVDAAVAVGAAHSTRRVGHFQLTVCSDGLLRTEAERLGAALLPADAAAALRPGRDGTVWLGLNCVLVETPDRLILVDAGFGDGPLSDDPDLERPEGSLSASLRRQGIVPKDIDLVILTHLHADHAGGCLAWALDGSSRPAFPNAEVVVQRDELEWALAEDPRDTMLYAPEEVRALAASGRLRTVEGSTTVAPGVRVIPAPGHSPGHQVVVLEDGEATAIVAGDLLHLRVHVGHPDVELPGDLDPPQAVATRRRILGDAIARRAVLISYHEATDPFLRPGVVE